jgi:hypothetical protein
MSVDDGHTSYNSDEMKEGVEKNLIEVNCLEVHDNNSLLIKAKELLGKNNHWVYLDI